MAHFFSSEDELDAELEEIAREAEIKFIYDEQMIGERIKLVAFLSKLSRLSASIGKAHLQI